MRLPRVGVGDGIILNSSSDWDLGSGRGLVEGGMGGSTREGFVEGVAGGWGVGAATEGGLEGGGWEEVESRCSRSCCCSNIFSRAVLHLMRVGRGTLWGQGKWGVREREGGGEGGVRNRERERE